MFGFCYPEDWEFSRFPQQVQYGTALDLKSADRLGVRRNMNVIIDDISSQKVDLDKLYESTLSQVLAYMPNAEIVFKEGDFIFQGLRAMRHRINWKPNTQQGPSISLYQIVVADKDKKNLYSISFTTTQEDFDTSRRLFDNIASTFRL